MSGALLDPPSTTPSGQPLIYVCICVVACLFVSWFVCLCVCLSFCFSVNYFNYLLYSHLNHLFWFDMFYRSYSYVLFPSSCSICCASWGFCRSVRDLFVFVWPFFWGGSGVRSPVGPVGFHSPSMKDCTCHGVCRPSGPPPLGKKCIALINKKMLRKKRFYVYDKLHVCV